MTRQSDLRPTSEAGHCKMGPIVSSEESSMPRHPNASLIRDALRAVARGEAETLKQLCADGIQWHAMGRTP